PWAVYQNTANLSRPGVNDFAIISPATGGIVSADSVSAYSIGSAHMNADRWGVTKSAAISDVSEGGQLVVTFDGGVEATEGSNVLSVSAFLGFDFELLVLDMRVTGPGLPSNTKIVALETNPLRIILSKNAIASHNTGTYVFERDRAYFGTFTAD